MPNELPDPVRSLSITRTLPTTRAVRASEDLVEADAYSSNSRTAFSEGEPGAFFWGSFDLAVTRFSGAAGAPRHPGGVHQPADAVACEAYRMSEAAPASGRAAGPAIIPRSSMD